MNNDLIKTIAAKAVAKSINGDVPPGDHCLDTTAIVRVKISGHAHQAPEESYAPTTHIPLIMTLALLIEKCGVVRERAISSLVVALCEAMEDGADKNAAIAERIKDVDTYVAAVKHSVISQLPKATRKGKLDLRGVQVTTSISTSQPRTANMQWKKGRVNSNA